MPARHGVGPLSETCKPIVTGQPCIPVITPYDDTLTSGLNCVSENLIVIQQLLQQMGQGGDGELIDPVTCTQLTGLVGQVNALLASIAKSVAAIAAGAGEPVTVNAPVTVNVPTQPPPTIEVNTTPPDLTKVVQALAAIFGTIDTPIPPTHSSPRRVMSIRSIYNTSARERPRPPPSRTPCKRLGNEFATSRSIGLEWISVHQARRLLRRPRGRRSSPRR